MPNPLSARALATCGVWGRLTRGRINTMFSPQSERTERWFSPQDFLIMDILRTSRAAEMRLVTLEDFELSDLTEKSWKDARFVIHRRGSAASFGGAVFACGS